MSHYTETERKFLLKTLPSFITSKPISYERHYIYNQGGIELRIQIKGDKFEMERKVKSSELGRETLKQEISEGEFERLKELSIGSIKRESYLVGDSNYDISIKVYHGNHDGLIRAEVEFKTEEEAKYFIPYEWMGKEITDSDLGRDSRLLDLSKEDFMELIGSQTV